MDKTLKRIEINALVSAINGLNGRIEPVKDQDGKFVGMIEKPFDIDLKATIAMAKTSRWLSSELEEYKTVQKAIQNKVRTNADGQPVSEAEKDSQVEDEIREYMLTPVDVRIHTFPAECLKIAANKLSSSVVRALLPMLTGELVDDEKS